MNEPLKWADTLLEEYVLLHPDQVLEIIRLTDPASLITNLQGVKSNSPSDPSPHTHLHKLLIEQDSQLTQLLEAKSPPTPPQTLQESLRKALTALLDSDKLESSPLCDQDQQAVPLTWIGKQTRLAPYRRARELARLFPKEIECNYIDPKQIYRLIHEVPGGRSALCFSGGGIRSASFGLGMLQGLARFGFLGEFTYLSTVSGGGYIGSWLSAWLRNSTSPDEVYKSLGARTAERNSKIPEPCEIEHLRRFRNYLSPNWSLLSSDTWTLLATYLRNLFLNWQVLISALIFICALPRIAVSLVSERLCLATYWNSIIFVSGALLTAWSIAYITWKLPFTTPRDEHSASPRVDQTQSSCELDIVKGCLLPLLAASCLFSWSWAQAQLASFATDWLFFVSFALVVHVIGLLFGLCLRKRFPGQKRSGGPSRTLSTLLILFLAIVVASAAGGTGAWLAATGVFEKPAQSPHFYIVFSAPVILTCFLLGGDILVGFYSRWTTDENREWKARLNALVLRACVVWVIGSTLVLYGPLWLSLSEHPNLLSSVGGLSGLAALFLGFSQKTNATQAGDEKETTFDVIRRRSLSIAAPLAVGFIIVFLSWCTSALLLKWSIAGTLKDTIDILSTIPGQTYFIAVASNHQDIVTQTSFSALLLLMLLCAGLAVGMGLFLDINKFSLHALYRDRLIRTFLGASNPARRPNCFTGFDPQDNIALASNQEQHTRPFHVINTAVNLLLTKETAWSDRKAASFTMSPLHCGSRILGFRDSSQYARNKARELPVSLGTALAISGAAASPNMGYHSSAAVTILMTLFNIRLGWWLGNPGKYGERTAGKWLPGETKAPAWKRSTPVFAPLWWMKEALGQTREDNAYVYLSDGGHFENLGLYEMVARRCRFIVVSDAGADPGHTFEDLGNAIRKIRVDFGIDIEIDLDTLRKNNDAKFTQWHLAIGTIRYDQADKMAPVGTLIYVKACLTGDEPADILEYAHSQPDFPHQTTSDQFFDEAQFESYRRLGEHTAREVFRPAKNTSPVAEPPKVATIFHELRTHWVTYPPGIRDSFLKTTDAFVRLETKLRDDAELSRFDTEIYPELETILGGPPASVISPGNTRANLHFCMQTIQLIEDVFIALHLDKYHAHPLNCGWMNAFRRLAGAPTLRKLWPSVKSSFSAPFVEFADYQLNLNAGSDPKIETRALNAAVQTQLLEELRLEWPRRVDIQEKMRLLLSNSQSIIVAASSPHLAAGKNEVWGVAIAQATDSKSYDLAVWVRGPYRNIGLGSALLKNLLQKLDSSLGLENLIITTTLPALEPDKLGYQLEKAGWFQFFLRYGFVLEDDTAEYYVLKKTLKME